MTVAKQANTAHVEPSDATTPPITHLDRSDIRMALDAGFSAEDVRFMLDLADLPGDMEPARSGANGAQPAAPSASGGLMPDSIDLGVPASVFVLPESPGKQEVTSRRSAVSLHHAIRFVMEVLPMCERPRALIRTCTRSLYAAEIEAVYHLPSFPPSRRE